MMRIALAQFGSIPGEVSQNTARMVARIREAVAAGCQLVAFPELADTGYELPKVMTAATAWNSGAMPALSAAAKEHRIHVIAGLAERDGADIFNTVAVISDDGTLIDKYRKIHLATVAPICEDRFLKAGDRRVVCDVAGVRTGIMTCYDIRFPELARWLALDGAELIVAPAAFPLVRIEHWKTINACRAIENQVYLAGVNRVGTDAGMRFGGASGLWDPVGTLLTLPFSEDDTLLIAELSHDRLTETRSKLHVYRDRRPDLY